LRPKNTDETFRFNCTAIVTKKPAIYLKISTTSAGIKVIISGENEYFIVRLPEDIKRYNSGKTGRLLRVIDGYG